MSYPVCVCGHWCRCSDATAANYDRMGIEESNAHIRKVNALIRKQKELQQQLLEQENELRQLRAFKAAADAKAATEVKTVDA
jgi:hypothetical protein